jgi:hypothetical protein
LIASIRQTAAGEDGSGDLKIRSGGGMLTDSEVDRRFSMLVAVLTSGGRAAELRDVNAPTEHRYSDDQVERSGSAPGVVALRVLAVVVGVTTLVVGVVLAGTLEFGVVLMVGWLAIVVPGVTLAAVLIADRLRRSR